MARSLLRALSGLFLAVGIAAVLVGNSLCVEAALAQDTARPCGQWRVGTAAVDLWCDDSMVIAGGIHPRYVQGQEGKLRATAIVLEDPVGNRAALVSCDCLMLSGELLKPVFAEINRRFGLPEEAVMIAATHTHHAPSTVRVHGYGADERFCQALQQAVIEAVCQAVTEREEVVPHFGSVQEEKIGQNSRLLLSDGTIFWIGSRTDAVRPTGPVDPDVPVLLWKKADGSSKAMLFCHASHAIGAVSGNVRSPTFYGLAAQEWESKFGGIAAFFQGAAGSTHRLDLAPQEALSRISEAILQASSQAKPVEAPQLRAAKRPFVFRVRTFDEAAEDQAVVEYCRKRVAEAADSIVAVFRDMRKMLAPHQGEKRITVLQTIAFGPVALVGIPAELFTKLGLEIKRRSPFRYTIVITLANDWIGYVPDSEAYGLGGYQVWTGLHSYAEHGAGERLVEEIVEMLMHLAQP